MQKKTFTILILFSSIFLQAKDSGYSFSHIPQINEGISQLSVLSICQDSRGYLWFGTRNGLNRFNGNDYVIYRPQVGDSLSLSDNQIVSLSEEKGNYLWIGTTHGLNRLCFRTNRIKRYYEKDGLPTSSILSVKVDSSNRVWVGTRLGLCLYNPEKDSFERVAVGNKLKSISISAIYEDNQNEFWIGTTSHGLYRCDNNMKMIAHYTRNTPQMKLADNYISTIYQDSDRNIWIGHRKNGLSKIEIDTNQLTTYTSDNSGLANNYIRCLIEWDKKLLIGTYNGIFSFNFSSETIEQVAGYNTTDRMLGHYSVYSFCLDSSETLWIGTYAGGVSLSNKIANRFKYHNPAESTFCKTGIYSAAYPGEDNTLWIATEGRGLLHYDIETKKQESYLLDEDNKSFYHSNMIKIILVEKEYIWCGTTHGEIYKFDIKRKTFSLFHKFPIELSVYAFLRDTAGNLWVGTSGNEYSLVCFTTCGKVVTRFTDRKGKRISFSTVRCLYEEKEGVLLIGTRSAGLIRFDTNKNSVKRYSDSTKAINYISGIIKSKNNGIWVSTYGGGIYRFNQNKDKLIPITEKQGLIDNYICKILEDREGTLWMSTVKGISAYNPLNETIKNYHLSNGIFLNEFSLHGGTTLPDGHICFTGNNGFITFCPDKMSDNPYIPPIVLEQLRVNNQLIEVDDGTGILDQVINETNTIRLKYNQNNISINYQALNYIFCNMNRYAYKLEGYDTEWNDVGKRNSAYYTNLMPGEYTFHVKACNNDGTWNEEGRSTRIIIAPPVWFTWYAYLFYGLSVLAILWTIFHFTHVRRTLKERLRLEQMEKKQQEEFHEAKIRLFTHFSHELRTPLTLIITPFEEIIKRIDIQGELYSKLSIIYKNAKKLLLLVNQLMDLQKNQTGKLKLKVAESNICEFMEEIYHAFNLIAQANDMQFTLMCRPKEIQAWYDKFLLEKIVFNLLSNAFKNTPRGGKIDIDVSVSTYQKLSEECKKRIDKGEDNTYIILRIEDSGKGIPESEKEKIFLPFYQIPQTKETDIPGSGIGLSLVYSIVKLHKGIIFVDSKKSDGACFIIAIPVNQSAYGKEEKDHQETEMFFYEEKEKNNLDPTSREIEKKYKVLIVEDNKEVRSYLRKALEEEFLIIEAPNGEKGQEKALQHFPDLILTDIMMPGKNGLELCSNIKNNAKTGHIPVVMMTARSMVIDIKEGFRNGADDYIIKPFNIEVLRTRIHNIITSREQLKRIYGKRFSPEIIFNGKPSADERFAQKLFDVIEKNISDQNLGVEMLCTEIGISRANFYRKLKSVTGLSLNELIRNKRMETAARYLKESDMSISDIVTHLGFKSHSYFTNSFKLIYGYTPSEYIKKNMRNKVDRQKTLCKT